MSSHTSTAQVDTSITVPSLQLNFSDPEVVAALKAFVHPHSKSTWILLQYSSEINALTLAGTGEEEAGEEALRSLRDELSDAHVMYGCVRVSVVGGGERSKTAFVVWVPAGVPTVIKGMVHHHIKSVSEFMRPYHLQIDARETSDLDFETVHDRCERSAGARY
ncbi:hypothetical protein H696_01282 [Fonticula alba]|uniref:ADF-H domain-containing protein n=1 Tax=Fonticula alba TaxID=691883 RepID=A0A058ZD60_FONAL|nr:hypothetical protein H696_01282 [Fonticula alba]KCV71868.1 hypothetical protein H696_01282 [Fonticula alba]|eukprot:XP_009493446.1 hypothetical protein H696_01282 [Fonticula alba]